MIMKRMKKHAFLITGILIVLIGGQHCGFYGRQRGPTDWHRIPRPDFQMPPYAQFLAGLSFCLDPGHGGDAQIAGYKRGPTGVREAEMNLRVAYFLKDYLETAGARVILTRTGDDNVDLRTRAEIANRNAVDIFISLHHNAVDNPRTNYASTWYHGDADYSPVSLDLARYIQQSLVDHFRLPNTLPTGLLSDYLMYPEGFGVLRYLQVPGILLESSFFSHPQEEKLLANPRYNRFEAYVIFLGIARWAAAGLPRVTLIEPHPDTSIATNTPSIYLKISDGLHERKGAWMLERQQVFSRQISFFLDDSSVAYLHFRDRDLLVHTPTKPLSNGWHTTHAEITNYWGNHNLPKKARFRIAPPAARLIAQPWTDRLPSDGRSFVGIAVTATDASGAPVADDDTVKAQSSAGQITPTALTRNGQTLHYLFSPTQPTSAEVGLNAGQAVVNFKMFFADSGTTLIEGFCRTVDGQPLADVSLTLNPESLEQFTNRDGVYFFPNITPGTHQLLFERDGYFGASHSLTVQDGQTCLDTMLFPAIYNGILHDYVIVIDPRFGGRETGSPVAPGVNSAQINLAVARILGDLFRRAGACAFLLRSDDTHITREKRVALSNQLPEGGYYLRLELDHWQDHQPLLIGDYYPGSERGQRLLQNLDSLLRQVSPSPPAQIHASSAYEIQKTNRAAIAVRLNALKHPDLDPLNTYRQEQLAWLILQSFLLELGRTTLPVENLQITLTDHGQPLAGYRVELGHKLGTWTDRNGRACFAYIAPSTYEITVFSPQGQTLFCQSITTIRSSNIRLEINSSQSP